MNKQSRLVSIANSKSFPLLLFAVSFVFVTLFSRSTSFLYVFEGGDPSIFKQMGLALLKGKTLYIDYFDNKGCILYFIQALGLWLGGDFFILLMQTVSLTVTLVIWDKMLALYRDGRSRLICFGIITFIRVNNAAPLLGFVAYSWLFLLLNKNFGRFFKSLASFLSGLLIIAGACVLYFYLKAGWHGVYEMVYGSFLSNFEYMALEVEIQPAYVYIVFFLFLALCIVQQILNSAKDKTILLPALFSYGFFILSSGNRCFMHYLMALLPLVIVLMMTLPPVFLIKRNIAFGVLLFESVCLYLPIPLALAVNDLVLKNDKYSVIYDSFHHCIEAIPEVERDSIYNYNLLGNGAGMMQHEGLLQCNRVFFTTFAFSMPTLRKEEEAKPMIPPKWIMVAWENYFTDGDAYFILDNYDEVFSFEHDRVYFEKPKIGNCLTVHIFRRKD